MDYAGKNCPDWVATQLRMPNAEAFLKTMRPMRLRDAPGGPAYQTTDAEVLRRGKHAYADKCIR